ncbi:hypothetical protein NEMBOFW57_006084 [Staphylotrichum longicolle]|uniref:methionyl-tRNA formyltransferase n=1 Tax=Staphylotrichum longicolle TaxID=669026 RepID=A0AAD4EXV6_9PEZI|nr:hypothetical protein NEMBOFW57_006084 [Staphylotrichum longicolle]
MQVDHPAFIPLHDLPPQHRGPSNFPAHPDAYLTADIFSPQRRGAKYLPGGLAAELRDWLVDVKGGVDGECEVRAASSVLRLGPSAGASVRVVVDEASCGGPGMTTASSKSDPLRILFCGSDQFSCTSLQALHDEQQRNGDLIQSIDVVVRPSKPSGRGLKVLREVPLRSLAEKLRLPIHIRDTFTGWNMPKPNGDPINLIIAVSFGLFVPPRLIHAAKYGGLNVHPSLLPDLRGPAPLHHALLHSYNPTGVTIQTLSPHAFDAGVPLLQTPLPGIPIPETATLPQLHDLLAPLGASMLVTALREGLHVPPHRPFPGYRPPGSSVKEGEGEVSLRHAPKITPADRQIRWRTAGGAQSVARQARVLGPLWTHLTTTTTHTTTAHSHSNNHANVNTNTHSNTNHVEDEPNSTKMTMTRAILADLSAVPATTNHAGEDEVASKPAEGFLDGRVAWVEMQMDGKKKNAQERMPVVQTRFKVDDKDESVVVSMADGSLLRVGKIKVEGSDFKPAAKVLESVLSLKA